MTEKPNAYRLTLHVGGIGEIVCDLPETGADQIASFNPGLTVPRANRTRRTRSRG